MWRYGKLKGKFSDGEMNDRFTDMGFSQGHQSGVGGGVGGGGGGRYSKLENRRNPELGKVPSRFNFVFQKPKAKSNIL